MDNKQPLLSIYSRVNLDLPLFDHRPSTYGIKFGSVKDICGQYGIKIIPQQGYTQFTAPKGRLQMLVEKLHFSQMRYSKQPLAPLAPLK